MNKNSTSTGFRIITGETKALNTNSFLRLPGKIYQAITGLFNSLEQGKFSTLQFTTPTFSTCFCIGTGQDICMASMPVVKNDFTQINIQACKII